LGRVLVRTVAGKERSAGEGRHCPWDGGGNPSQKTARTKKEKRGATTAEGRERRREGRRIKR